MRHIFFIVLFSISSQFFAQDVQMAYQYFRNGDYEKSVTIFKDLHEKNRYNSNYLGRYIESLQYLEKYEEAATVINNQFKSFPRQSQAQLFILLGYNYQLQHQQVKANSNYEKALNSIENEPNSAYLIGKTFQESHLLNYALKAYKKGMVLNPNANYNFQIASIFAEKGEVQNLFDTYLNMVETNDDYSDSAKNLIGNFITEDPENDHNQLLKKLLLKRLQNNPLISWNELLSWLFVQQKEYEKALVQEKAIFKRVNSLSGIFNLGKIAFENNQFEVAQECFTYLLENQNNREDELAATLYLLEIDLKTEAAINKIEKKFEQFFNKYGKNAHTANVLATYAEFTTYKKNDPEKGISILQETLQLPLNEFQIGELKIKLADMLVFTNKFSSALIYYTQVQNSLKNQVIGQNARFKIAQTSYFNGDFEWAQVQLKVLKDATSQLIANDALALHLLITDNLGKDSLQVALKKYALADLLSSQQKNQQAIDTLQSIIKEFKDHPILDEALFKQAQLFEKIKKYEDAEHNYLQILTLNKTDILADDALFYLGKLYLYKLQNTVKATEIFQNFIFEYPSSIYFVEARKKFRELRGDSIN